jgi:hypothetical protein
MSISKSLSSPISSLITMGTSLESPICVPGPIGILRLAFCLHLPGFCVDTFDLLAMCDLAGRSTIDVRFLFGFGVALACFLLDSADALVTAILSFRLTLSLCFIELLERLCGGLKLWRQPSVCREMEVAASVCSVGICQRAQGPTGRAGILPTVCICRGKSLRP